MQSLGITKKELSMLPNFLACHRHLHSSLSPQKKPQQLPMGQSVLAALIDGDKWSSGFDSFLLFSDAPSPFRRRRLL